MVQSRKGFTGINPGGCEKEMFSFDNTQGFTEDEIDSMNSKLIFRCAKIGISPIPTANRDHEKDQYDRICEQILEET